MSGGYRVVQWNRFKIRYDWVIAIGLLVYLCIFVVASSYWFPSLNFNTILIRAFGSLAIVLLHVILSIGPLSRLSTQWLPVLYNRRHLGVSMFALALVHGLLSLQWFHGGGNIFVLQSLFESNQHFNSWVNFPFQVLGFFALLIFGMMAMTSHDAWLHFFSAKWWKYLHMLVYVAYVLVLLHVVLGILVLEKHPVYVVLIYLGLIFLVAIHLLAAFKEKPLDAIVDKEWYSAGQLDEFVEGRARMVTVKQERVAVFLNNGRFSAVHNVCKHQGGPLGEGKMVDGCITCPWHGYQYRPEDGCAPPPFTEKLATYPLKYEDGQLWVFHQSFPEGTPVEPLDVAAPIKEQAVSSAGFFIGWDNHTSLKSFNFSRVFSVTLCSCWLLLPLLLANFQKAIGPFAINYNQTQHLEGWLVNKPFPLLRIPDASISGQPYKSVLLVDAFKKGADELVEQVLGTNDKAWVKLDAYLSNKVISCGPDGGWYCNVDPSILLNNQLGPMAEIADGKTSIAISSPKKSWSEANNTMPHPVTLQGEIIDPKCFFGAMNPGFGKPHLSCAVRCIEGGIMPAFHYKLNGLEKFAVITLAEGKQNSLKIRDWVGFEVELKGELKQYDNLSILEVSDVRPLH